LLPPPPTDPYVSNSLIRFVSNGPDRTINLAVDETTRRHGCCCPSRCTPVRSDSCAIGCQFRADSLRAQSPSCLSLAPTPCPALPSRAPASVIMGPLGLGSPCVRAGDVPCPAVLCVATTACVLPGRSAFGSLPVPWCDALFFVFLRACARFGSSIGRVAQQMPGCWLSRSPLFRRLLPRRREALPSSRITLVPTCPALRPRWCPARSPWCEQDCCLPARGCRRLWVRLPGLILLATIIHFSEFNDAACVLALPLLRTPLLSGRTSVRLPTRWLAFGRVGLELPLTHWVTLTCFKRCLLYSHVPSLARRDQHAC
jgi:hypothetical protein